MNKNIMNCQEIRQEFTKNKIAFKTLLAIKEHGRNCSQCNTLLKMWAIDQLIYLEPELDPNWIYSPSNFERIKEATFQKINQQTINPNDKDIIDTDLNKVENLEEEIIKLEELFIERIEQKLFPSPDTFSSSTPSNKKKKEKSQPAPEIDLASIQKDHKHKSSSNDKNLA